MGGHADSPRTVPSGSYDPSTTGTLWRWEGDNAAVPIVMDQHQEVVLVAAAP